MKREKPVISCEHCGKQYKFEGSLKKHIAKAHVGQEVIKVPLDKKSAKSQDSRDEGSESDSEISDRSKKNSPKGIEFISIQER